jgi:hypothetical protein
MTVSCPTSAQVSGRKTFVLVHGFYHGGWCWRGVADLLEVRGHKVYAHRLPATATARIFSVSTSGLDTQIADIANLVIWEDLNDVCLLRIRLAAVPRRARFASVQSSGSTRSNRSTDRKVSSTFRSSAERLLRSRWCAESPATSRHQPRRSRSARKITLDGFEADSAAERPAMQVIKLTGKREAIAKKTYIRTPKYPQAAFDKALVDCNGAGNWQTIINDYSGHDAMTDQPAWLESLVSANLVREHRVESFQGGHLDRCAVPQPATIDFDGLNAVCV